MNVHELRAMRISVIVNIGVACLNTYNSSVHHGWLAVAFLVLAATNLSVAAWTILFLWDAQDKHAAIQLARAWNWFYREYPDIEDHRHG